MSPLFGGRAGAQAYAALRIVAGMMFMTHGVQKLFGAFGQPPVPLASLAGAAGVVELICGALLVVGLFGPIAAFIASGEMAFAYFMVHAPRAFWPLANQGELAVVYCFLFLNIAVHGSGIWSLDALLARRRLQSGQAPSEPIAH